VTLRVVHSGTGNVGVAGLLSYRIEIEGDPSYTLELNFGSDGGGGKITAMPAINAIPAVCAAEPGLNGPLDIPGTTPATHGARERS
jgi:hypothetical protein